MRRDRRHLLGAILLLPLALRAAGAAAQGAPAALPTGELVIIGGGRRHSFKVELAATDEARTRGLMYRRALAADAGMLFDYRAPTHASMWMRNTYIPLDMLFITADGRILNIHERAIPHDLTPIGAAGPVRAVLELNGGTVARLGIKPGDRVEHAIFAAGR
jgi:hypothetical protein